MCVSDSDDEINLSLEGLAPDLETLKKAQRVVVIPKERAVHKFTRDASQLSVQEFREVRAACAAQAIETGEDKVQFLWSHQLTALREELQYHPKESRATTKGIFDILKNVYGGRRTICQLLTIFNGIYQKPEEGV